MRLVSIFHLMAILAIALPVPALAQQPNVQAPATDREALFWQSIKDSKDPNDFKAYLDAFPNGLYAPLAKNRMKAAASSAPASEPEATASQRSKSASQPESPDPLGRAVMKLVNTNFLIAGANNVRLNDKGISSKPFVSKQISRIDRITPQRLVLRTKTTDPALPEIGRPAMRTVTIKTIDLRRVQIKPPAFWPQEDKYGSGGYYAIELSCPGGDISTTETIKATACSTNKSRDTPVAGGQTTESPGLGFGEFLALRDEATANAVYDLLLKITGRNAADSQSVSNNSFQSAKPSDDTQLQQRDEDERRARAAEERREREERAAEDAAQATADDRRRAEREKAHQDLLNNIKQDAARSCRSQCSLSQQTSRILCSQYPSGSPQFFRCDENVRRDYDVCTSQCGN